MSKAILTRRRLVAPKTRFGRLGPPRGTYIEPTIDWKKVVLRESHTIVDWIKYLRREEHSEILDLVSALEHAAVAGRAFPQWNEFIRSGLPWVLLDSLLDSYGAFDERSKYDLAMATYIRLVEIVKQFAGQLSVSQSPEEIRCAVMLVADNRLSRFATSLWHNRSLISRIGQRKSKFQADVPPLLGSDYELCLELFLDSSLVGLFALTQITVFLRQMCSAEPSDITSAVTYACYIIQGLHSVLGNVEEIKKQLVPFKGELNFLGIVGRALVSAVRTGDQVLLYKATEVLKIQREIVRPYFTEPNRKQEQQAYRKSHTFLWASTLTSLVKTSAKDESHWVQAIEAWRIIEFAGEPLPDPKDATKPKQPSTPSKDSRYWKIKRRCFSTTLPAFGLGGRASLGVQIVLVANGVMLLVAVGLNNVM
ncbi:hypothetical protein EIP91_001743 [Steccherinum ochraceum]|uniref:Uncharacterized protein n=1 Tax=Steccherinum ochraceum TaxID=92696 RepID=A0A4R0RU39_9APHY|nr:hypothetical protein EIP91_001743 [Steccherinum ochraceum]